MLFKYYKENHGENRDILTKGIEYGEKISAEYKKLPFYEDAVFMLADIYFFETFEFNKANHIYQQLVDEIPDTKWKAICRDRINLINENIFDIEPLSLYVTAEKYFEQAKFEQAEFYLKEILNKYPAINLAASALYFLGDINYYKFNDLDKSLEYYRLCARKFPGHTVSQHAFYRVGEILRKLRRWEEAVEVYKMYVKKYRSSPYTDDAYYFIGESFQNLGKLREAKNAFSLILGDYPESKWTDVIYHKVQEINRILREI
jgi:TolA-binding protein